MTFKPVESGCDKQGFCDACLEYESLDMCFNNQKEQGEGMCAK